MAWTRRDGNKKGRMVSKYRRWKIPCIREEQHGINSRPCNNNNNPRSNSQPFLNFPFRTFHRFVLFFNRRDDDYSWIRFIPNRSKMIRPRLIMAADKWFRSAIRSRDIVRWAHVFWTWEGRGGGIMKEGFEYRSANCYRLVSVTRRVSRGNIANLILNCRLCSREIPSVFRRDSRRWDKVKVFSFSFFNDNYSRSRKSRET